MHILDAPHILHTKIFWDLSGLPLFAQFSLAHGMFSRSASAQAIDVSNLVWRFVWERSVRRDNVLASKCEYPRSRYPIHAFFFWESHGELYLKCQNCGKLAQLQAQNEKKTLIWGRILYTPTPPPLKIAFEGWGAYKKGRRIKFLPRGGSEYTPPPPSPEKYLLARNGGKGGGADIISPWN